MPAPAILYGMSSMTPTMSRIDLGSGAGRPDGEGARERIAPVQEHSRERLVHDRDRARVPPVTGIEHSPGHELAAHRFEKTRRYDPRVGVVWAVRDPTSRPARRRSPCRRGSASAETSPRRRRGLHRARRARDATTSFDQAAHLVRLTEVEGTARPHRHHEAALAV